MKQSNSLMLVVILLFTFSAINTIFSDTGLTPHDKARNCALENAKAIWGEQIQINQGITFTDLNNEATAYVFAIYKGKGNFPSDYETNLKIKQARNTRIKGERLLDIAKEVGDSKEISGAYKIIDNGWKQMLDEENFATAVISDISGICKPVEMYDGLPLNYVSMLDGFDLASEKLGKNDLQFSRFIFNGLFEYFAEFKNSNESVFVNLKLLEVWENKPTQKDFDFINHWRDEKKKSKDIQNDTKSLKKTAITPYETKLSGVPDYQSSCHRCAEHAAGNVLGYWDHRGYPLLVEGGTKWTAGHVDPNGYGYEHLCKDELCETMGWTGCDGGTPANQIDNGIEELCNDSEHGRNYNFQSVDRGFRTPESDYSFVQSEISTARPMVYILKYHLWGGGSGYHAVTLIGHGATYEHYYYVCHDVSPITGTNIRLYWEEFMSSGRIYTVIPGGSSYSSNHITPSLVLVSADNKPNPFNPETEIHYQTSKPATVKIYIYNALGEHINDLFYGFQETGTHSICWDGRDKVGNTVSSGTYLFVISTEQEKISKKMLLIR
jgi:hypothetical protein